MVHLLFIYHIITLPNTMARFEEAENRNLDAKICRKCNARNPKKAERCRKCGSTQLRGKHKESKGKGK